MTQGGILSPEGGGGGLTESQVFTGDGVGAVGLLDGMFQFFGLPNTPPSGSLPNILSSIHPIIPQISK